MDAIARGDFYASSGVMLKDIPAAGGEYRIAIEPRSTEKFTTYFIGEGGKVLARSFDLAPSHRLAAGDKYVRARVESSFGSMAWTQPMFQQ